MNERPLVTCNTPDLAPAERCNSPALIPIRVYTPPAEGVNHVTQGDV